MKSAVIMVTCLLLHSTAFATNVAVRIPLLFEDSQGRTLNVADIEQELKASGIELPEFIEVTDQESGGKLLKFGQTVEDANVTVAGDKYPLSIVNFGRISSYQGPGVKHPMCYRVTGSVSLEEAAQEASDLAGSLVDSVLSDQYLVIGVRVFGQTEFQTYDGEQETQGYLKKTYGQAVLAPGDVQIIAATGDSGDDDQEDRLSLCK